MARFPFEIPSEKAGKTFTRVCLIRGIGVESGMCNALELFATGHFVHHAIYHIIKGVYKNTEILLGSTLSYTVSPLNFHFCFHPVRAEGVMQKYGTA